MKRKLNQFWREWGITWDEFKMFLSALGLLATIFSFYIILWLLY